MSADPIYQRGLAFRRQRTGSAWVQLQGGRRFWPLDPDPADVDVRDIARALSRLCRYGGHTTLPYSVAEHSVLLSRAAPSGFEMEALLHDGAEAYLADICRPVKVAPVMEPVREVLARIERCVAWAFNLPLSLSREVQELDLRICEDERRALFPLSSAGEWWPHGAPRMLDVDIECLAPWAAEVAFISRFIELGGELPGRNR